MRQNLNSYSAIFFTVKVFKYFACALNSITNITIMIGMGCIVYSSSSSGGGGYCTRIPVTWSCEHVPGVRARVHSHDDFFFPHCLLIDICVQKKKKYTCQKILFQRRISVENDGLNQRDLYERKFVWYVCIHKSVLYFV